MFVSSPKYNFLLCKKHVFTMSADLSGSRLGAKLLCKSFKVTTTSDLSSGLMGAGPFESALSERPQELVEASGGGGGG